MRKKVRKPLAFLMALLMTMSVFGSQVLAEDAPSSDAAVVTQGDEGAADDAASAETPASDSGQSAQAGNAKSAGQQDAGQTDADAGNPAGTSVKEGKQDADQAGEASADTKKGSAQGADVQSSDTQNSGTQNSDMQSSESQGAGAQGEDAQTDGGSSVQQVEYVPEEQPDGVSVKAYAAKGTLPDGAVMKVTMLNEKGETADQYDEAAAAMEESDIDYEGFLAMDISFYDADGNEIEPEDGAVNVKFEVDESLLPEDVEADSLAVQHLAETDGGIQVETVADAADVTDGSVEVEDEAVKAEFEVERFSTFTITWGTYIRVTVHYVDETGKEINGNGYNRSIKSGDEIVFDEIAEETVDGLQYKRAAFSEDSKYSESDQTVTSVLASEFNIIYHSRNLTFYNEDQEIKTLTWDNWFNEGLQTAHVFLVYGEVGEDPVTPPGGITEPTPGYSKTATLNDDGTYDLTLSVTGAVGSQENPALVDVLMIVDTSDSMNANHKLSNTKSAMNALINSLENSENVNAQYSIVRFGSKNSSNFYNGTYDDSSVLMDWGDASTARSTVSNISAWGGTNYQAGLRRGAAQLGDSDIRQNAIKIVIFLSDGNPTYYIGGGNGSNSLDRNGNGWKSTLDEAGTITCDRFYSIRIGNANSAYLTDLRDAANATVKQYISANDDGSNLTSIFQDIAGSATQLNVSNVTISDTLSGNVEAVVDKSGNPIKPFVKVTDKEGEDVTKSIPEVENQLIYPTYEKGILKLEFPDDYKLLDGYTYSVTLKIQPSALAEIAYANTGTYPDTPDQNTGTHSEQNEKGFYSNENAKAILTYKTDNDTELKEVKYNKPVVQVQKGYLTLGKQLAEGTIVPEGTEFTFTVSIPVEYAGSYNALYSSDAEGEVTKVTFNAVSGSGNATAEIQLSAREKVTIALPEGIRVHITENSEGYTAEWSGGTKDGNGMTTEISKENRVEIICTNKVATGNLILEKKIEGIDSDDLQSVSDVKFTFQIEKMNGNQTDSSFNENGFTSGIRNVEITTASKVPLENLPIGEYRVTEAAESIPQNIGDYVYVGNSGTKSVQVTGSQNVTASITNTYKHQDKTLTIEKNVDGNMSSASENFDFKLTVLSEQDQVLESYQDIINSALKTDADEVQLSISLKFDSDGTAIFSLSAGQKLEIKVPHGVNYSVAEDSKDYKGTATVVGSGSFSNGKASGEIDQNTTVTFTNTKNIDAPTGIARAVIPFAAMVVIALGAAVTFIIRRRFRR